VIAQGKTERRQRPALRPRNEPGGNETHAEEYGAGKVGKAEKRFVFGGGVRSEAEVYAKRKERKKEKGQEGGTNRHIRAPEKHHRETHCE
jgi:hypothetical protein